MKTVGTLLRLLAIFVVLVLSVTTIANYAIYTEELKEAREELEEDREEHENEYDEYHDSDCYECENFDDREKSYDRSSTRNIISNIQSIMVYLVYGGILFALGSIVANKGRKIESEAVPAQIPLQVPVQAQPQAPIATEICPTCGAALKAGSHFCGRCGTVIGN